VDYKLSPELKIAKTVPELGIMACSGNGNGRKGTFNPGLELKTLVLMSSSLLSTKSKKRSPLAITEGGARGQHKTGKGKAQKFVQVITIFVNRP